MSTIKLATSIHRIDSTNKKGQHFTVLFYITLFSVITYTFMHYIVIYFSFQFVHLSKLQNSGCFSQANTAGRLLHQIDTEDEEVKDQIEMFSLQIVNEKLEYSAAGFFPVNYSLVFSVSSNGLDNLSR